MEGDAQGENRRRDGVGEGRMGESLLRGDVTAVEVVLSRNMWSGPLLKKSRLIIHLPLRYLAAVL